MGSTEISNYEPGEAIDSPPPPALPVQTGWKSLDGLTKTAIITCTLMVVAFIAPPLGFAFALATIGLSAGALSAARRDDCRNGAAFNTLMISSAALAVLVVGSLLMIDSAPSSITVGEPIPVAAGAPPADVYVALDSIGRSGSRETAAVNNRIDVNQVDGSVVHVANATSALGTTEIYRYKSLASVTGGVNVELTCIGEISTYLAGGSCGYDETWPEGVAPGNVSWSKFTEGTQQSFNVMIWSIAPEGVWMSIETETGVNVVSNIVEGVGFADYQAKYGRAQVVSALDADHKVIWSQDIGNG